MRRRGSVRDSCAGRDDIGARAFPSPQPSPGGRGGWSVPRGGLVSAGNPCASRLTPKYQRTPNGPLSLWERVRVRGPQACPGREARHFPCPRIARRARSYNGNDIGVRAFPSPQPSPGGRGGWSVPRGGLVSAGNPCAGRLTPKYQRTPNGPLSLWERVRVRGPQACPGREARHFPCPRIARRARSYRGMAWVGQRSGSHPRIAPGRPAIADKVRSYGSRKHGFS